MKKLPALTVIGLLIATFDTLAAEVTRYPLTSDFPIAQAVQVDDTLYHSGLVPAPHDTSAEHGSIAYWGTTEQQTISVFEQMRASLEAKQMQMSDVVKLTVFLVAEPNSTEGMDFTGFMKAYNLYFGEATDGKLPARSVVEVAALYADNVLVEIEAIAVRSASD